MFISLIATLTRDHVIGKQNNIPWLIPADRCWFKYHTIYKPIIMGRKTFESIGNALPDRLNIVLSRKYKHGIEKYGILFCNNLEQVLFSVKMFSEIMIIGGGEIYNIFFSLARRLYLTYVDISIPGGDVWFPFYDLNKWRLVFDVCGVYKVSNNLESINYCFKIFEI